MRKEKSLPLSKKPRPIVKEEKKVVAGGPRIGNP